MSNILVNFALYLLGSFTFLFFYWVKLKEDYDSSEIFTTGFYFLGITTLSALVFAKFIGPFLPASPVFSPLGLWFWGGVVGYAVTSLLAIHSFSMNPYELFEGSSVGLLPLLSFFILRQSNNFTDIPALVVGVASLVIFGTFFAIESNYKKFSWYASGKIGFASLVSFGFFFLLRSIFAFFVPNTPSFIGRLDVVTSGVVAFLLFFTVYNRAEQ